MWGTNKPQTEMKSPRTVEYVEYVEYVESLQKLVNILCATELDTLEMSINGNKSVCMIIGTRFNKHCANNISVQDGQERNWVQSCRYLGITVESASHFKCNIGEAKKSFYRSFNAIFGRVGRIAKETVTVELIMKKCLPTLLYAMDVCPLNKSDIRALDYVVDSAL